MKQGFIKVAAATPDIRVADVPFNTKQICSAIEEAQNNQAKIVVFPELCVTGYTCGDLFTPVSYTHLTLPTTPYV